jgi:hypothetical protein
LAKGEEMKNEEIQRFSGEEKTKVLILQLFLGH